MSAQQAPHTPPMWRKFLSLPHTRLGWWAVGLSGTFWVLILTDEVWYFTWMQSSSGVLQWLVLCAVALLGVAGTVVASIALLRGLERSALVWLAMVAGLPAFLLAGWNVLVFAGMNWLGEIPTLLVMVALVVLISVLIAWLQRYKSFGEEVVMNTQHAPHTLPLWRRVISLPTTRLGWLALGLAAVSVVLLTFAVAAVISPFAFQAFGIELEWILWSLWFSWVASGVVGLIAVIWRREHSWIVLVVAYLGVLMGVAIPFLPFGI